MQKTQVQSLGQEDSLEEEMATHSIILAWKIPWTKDPGRLQSMELQSQTRPSMYTHTHTHSLSLSLFMPRYRSRHTYTNSGMIMSIIVLLNHLRVNYSHHDPLSLSTFVCLLIANQRILSSIITVSLSLRVYI